MFFVYFFLSIYFLRKKYNQNFKVKKNGRETWIPGVTKLRFERCVHDDFALTHEINSCARRETCRLVVILTTSFPQCQG